jgi:hypothetical protein
LDSRGGTFLRRRTNDHAAPFACRLDARLERRCFGEGDKLRREALDSGGKRERKPGRGKQRHRQADAEEEQKALENRRHFEAGRCPSLKLGTTHAVRVLQMGDAAPYPRRRDFDPRSTRGDDLG